MMVYFLKRRLNFCRGRAECTEVAAGGYKRGSPLQIATGVSLNRARMPPVCRVGFGAEPNMCWIALHVRVAGVAR